jgi:hypothetical protein
MNDAVKSGLTSGWGIATNKLSPIAVLGIGTDPVSVMDVGSLPGRAIGIFLGYVFICFPQLMQVNLMRLIFNCEIAAGTRAISFKFNILLDFVRHCAVTSRALYDELIQATERYFSTL